MAHSKMDRREAFNDTISGLVNLTMQDFEDLTEALANLDELMKTDLRERIRQEEPKNRNWDDSVYKRVQEVLRTTKNIRVNARRIDEYCRLAGFTYAA